MSFSSPYLYECVVFNQPYYSKTLSLQDKFTLVGTVEKISGSKININVKKIKVGEIDKNDSLQPVYHLPSQIGHATYLALLKRTFDAVNTEIKTLTPSYLINKYNLLTHIEALDKVHFPKTREDVALGLRTLKFEECLEYCFKNKLIRLQNEQLEKTIDVEINTNKINDFVKNLPYKLTKDQVTSIREIVLDMKSKKLMYRLLQGDVGTGKTIVAVTSLYANYLRKGQGVLLAPTDSLARQHYDSVKSFFKDYGINVVLLIGSLTQSKKNEIKEQIKNGEADIVVGTHALFSSTVEYKKLSLAIIDEQHRFGVMQRSAIIDKGRNSLNPKISEPNLLMMSATPIPQSLALTLFGDLDISTIHTKPAGRKDITTYLVKEGNEINAYEAVRKELEKGRQAYFVYPAIDSDENIKSAERAFAHLRDHIYPQYKCALLHSKVEEEEQVQILHNFRDGSIQVLAATTVIEVGVDVPNATCMVIEGADHFGMA
jgi:ATP-dependent DNA helicase RecG